MANISSGSRVLQLGPLYNNHLRRWSDHAVAAGWEVWAAGHLRPGRRQADLSSLVSGVHVAAADADRGEWLEGVLERVRPDLVQGHFLHEWAHTAVERSNVPVVVTPWGSDLYEALEGPLRERADAALMRADRVLARSPHMHRELLSRGVPEDRIAEVDLGVNLDRFRPGAAAPARPVVLSFRAGPALYNLDVVVEAFERVRCELPGARLNLARGDAPPAPALSALLPAPGVSDLGAVGYRKMPELMRTAAVGVSIPSFDGSPSSVWEALASGLPVVLSDLPQVRERLEGCSAVRFADPEPRAVAAALLDLLRSDRDTLSRAARGWAERDFDQREQRARLAALYATMSSSGKRGAAACGGAPATVR